MSAASLAATGHLGRIVLLPLLLAAAVLLSIGTSAATLRAGDLVMIVGHDVLAYDSETLQGVRVASGLPSPARVTVDRRHKILVTDGTSGLVEIEPSTGEQTVLATVGQLGGTPRGLCAGPDGRIFVTLAGTAPGIASVVPGAAPVPLTSGGLLSYPSAVTFGADGMLYACELYLPQVACGGTVSRGGIVRVDPVSGAQTLLASGCDFRLPADIAAVGTEVWSTRSGGVSGVGNYILQTRLSDGFTYVSPLPFSRTRGIAAASDGSVWVGDCTILNHDCNADLTEQWPSGRTIPNVAGPMAVVPEVPTPARSMGWGALKVLYR